jgi:bifunctional non-homologous end joining protein LigD
MRRMPLPRAQPIIPTWRKEPFDDPEWVFEFKYDGFRALLYLEKQSCRLIWGRRSTLSCFHALCDQLAANLEIDDAILDGEVIAADKTEHQRFYKVLRRTRKPAYVASDLLWLNGADLRPLPLSERRRRLQGILPKRSSVIFEALSVQGRGCELFELMHAHDLEGIIAKRLDDPYNPRVRWLKIKNPDYSQR